MVGEVHPAGTSIILRDFEGKGAETIQRLVCPLPETTRIRVGNKSTVKEQVELAIKRMVQESVAHARFVDVARFWVAYLEVLIVAVTVCPSGKVCTEL